MFHRLKIWCLESMMHIGAEAGSHIFELELVLHLNSASFHLRSLIGTSDHVNKRFTE